MPSRRNKKKGKAPAGTAQVAELSKTASVGPWPALGSGGASSATPAATGSDAAAADFVSWNRVLRSNVSYPQYYPQASPAAEFEFEAKHRPEQIKYAFRSVDLEAPASWSPPAPRTRAPGQASLEHVRVPMARGLGRGLGRGRSITLPAPSVHDTDSHSPVLSRVTENSPRTGNPLELWEFEALADIDRDPFTLVVPRGSALSSAHQQSGIESATSTDGDDDVDVDAYQLNRFQDSFPRYPAVDVDDIYEFPALPAAAAPQPMRQATGPTSRHVPATAQPRRNTIAAYPQRPLIITPPGAPMPHHGQFATIASLSFRSPRGSDPVHVQSTPLPSQSNVVDPEATLNRKLAEEASVLLEFYSQSTYQGTESELQNRETIKTALSSVNQIWDSLSRSDKGKQASYSVGTVSTPEGSRLTGGGSDGKKAAELESDQTLSPYAGCIICYNAVADAVLIPCHHLVLCLVSRYRSIL